MKTWLPFRLVRCGQTFKYKKVKFLKIKGIMSIGKDSYNLVYCKTGDLGYLDPETAVQV